MKKIKFQFMAMMILIIQHHSFAQNISLPVPNQYVNEPSIAIDINNTDNMVVGANGFYFYTSDDAGDTWTLGELESSLGVSGDPCIISGNSGEFYYFHLSNSFLDQIVCQKMEDFSGNWNNGSGTGINPNPGGGGYPRGQDKEWADIDRNNGNIYLAWTEFDNLPCVLGQGMCSDLDSSNIVFSSSTDNGESWNTPIRINKEAGLPTDMNDNTAELAMPCVAPNGDVYVIWANGETIYFDKSTDAGITWLENDIEAASLVGGWNFESSISGLNRCNAHPTIVCDKSGGANHGTIYISWCDQRNGADDTDVWLTKSTDGGNNWTPATRINNDATGKQQFLSWMTIDQTTGVLYFVFYDRRNYNDDNTDVYLAVSEDAGTTFVNTKISDAPFVPISSVFFGDYTNISAHNGIIRAIWVEQNSGENAIIVSKIDEILTSEPKIELPVPIIEGYPNPFYNSTFISFKLRNETNITLKVFDVYGNEIATLIDNKHYSQGKYVQKFNALEYNIESGSYFYKLIYNNKIKTGKIIYLK